jgi:hypothetical protein
MKIVDTNVFSEVDFSEEIQGSMHVQCDACKAKLGETYARHKDAISLTLKGEKDDQGYDSIKNHHFCNEGCLRGFLNKRAEATSSK